MLDGKAEDIEQVLGGEPGVWVVGVVAREDGVMVINRLCEKGV